VNCSQVHPAAQPGAAATLGLDARNATTPAWSGTIGRPLVVVGGTSYGTTDGHCIVAADVATGHVDWIAAAPADHPDLFDVVADPTTVLAATGVDVGQAPADVSPMVDQLVAYDPQTGHRRWDVEFPYNGQGMPAALIGTDVVVSMADGSLLGLTEQSGLQRWHDPPPPGCAGTTSDGVEPNAALIGTASPGAALTAVVAYLCPGGDSIAEVDVVNGATRWTWRVPEGWELAAQTAAVVVTGPPGGAIVIAPISPDPPANAPAAIAPAPGPAVATRLADSYGYSEHSDVVVLDSSTGHPMWDLTDVVGQVASAGGAGTLCVLNDFGADCRDATDGAFRWSVAWPGDHASATYPALSCIDQAAISQPCDVGVNGRLYVALGAASAPAYPSGPLPPTPSGAFMVAAFSMSNGAVVSRIPLPEFNNPGTDHAVSLAVPPAVLLVADGTVLVSPQFDETDVVEAFAQPVAG